MDWLVSIRKSASPEQVRDLLARAGCVAEDAPPIPLGDDEQVVSVSGPPDLPARLENDERVVKVSPNSGLTLY